MNESKYGYLAKLRALRDMKGTTNAHNVSRHLDVTYECARSGLRRMEAAGLQAVGAAVGSQRLLGHPAATKFLDLARGGFRSGTGKRFRPQENEIITP